MRRRAREKAEELLLQKLRSCAWCRGHESRSHHAGMTPVTLHEHGTRIPTSSSAAFASLLKAKIMVYYSR